MHRQQPGLPLLPPLLQLLLLPRKAAAVPNKAAARCLAGLLLLLELGPLQE
jgi:hypothetical protein